MSYSAMSSWTKLDTDNPLAQLELTFFFNVVEQAYSRGVFAGHW